MKAEEPDKQSIESAKAWLEQQGDNHHAVFLLKVLNFLEILLTKRRKIRTIQQLFAEKLGFAASSEQTKKTEKGAREGKGTGKKSRRKKRPTQKTTSGKRPDTNKERAAEGSANLPDCPEGDKTGATERNYPIGEVDADDTGSENRDVDKKETSSLNPDDLEYSREQIVLHDIRLLHKTHSISRQVIRDRKTGRVIKADLPEAPEGSKYTYRAMALMVMLHVGHHLPLNRLEALFSNDKVAISKSTIFGFLVSVAEAFLPIMLFLIRTLVKEADVLETDDAGMSRTLHGDSEDLTTCEADLDEKPTPAMKLARSLHEEIGLVSYNSKEKPLKMRLTVITGLVNSVDGMTRIVIKLSHFGTAGTLIGRLVSRFRSRKDKPSFWLVSDSSTANAPVFEGKAKFSVHAAGCGAHARRRAWRYRDLDDLMWALIRGFNGLALVEKWVKHLGGDEKMLLSWRQRFSKKIWNWIIHNAKKIQKKWPKGTEPWETAEYILSNEYTLKRYLKHPELPYTNNRCERFLRPEKLMLSNSKFRESLGGRIAFDIVASIMATCLANGVSFLDYTIDIIRNRDLVAVSPEKWTPIAWMTRQKKAQN